MRKNKLPTLPHPLPETGWLCAGRYYRCIEDIMNDRRIKDDEEIIPLGVCHDARVPKAGALPSLPKQTT